MSFSSLWIGLATLLGLYLLYNAFFLLFHEKILFQGDQLVDDHEFTFVFQYEEVNLNPSRDVRLNGLLLKSDTTKGLILYFHGNSGNLERWGHMANDIRQKHGYDVLVIDYRTYGKSRGERNEVALYEDATFVYDYAYHQLEYENIIVHGRSLGTAIGTYLAANRAVSHLILETPMTRLREVIPVLDFLLVYKPWLEYEFNSLARINEISCPITILHGTEDAVVPFELGRQLYAEIEQSNKKFITIDNGKHNNLDTFEIYQQTMEQILN